MLLPRSVRPRRGIADFARRAAVLARALRAVAQVGAAGFQFGFQLRDDLRMLARYVGCFAEVVFQVVERQAALLLAVGGRFVGDQP